MIPRDHREAVLPVASRKPVGFRVAKKKKRKAAKLMRRRAN